MSQLVPIKTSKLSPFEQNSIEMGDLPEEESSSGKQFLFPEITQSHPKKKKKKKHRPPAPEGKKHTSSMWHVIIRQMPLIIRLESDR
jgi:hypothetical protein